MSIWKLRKAMFNELLGHEIYLFIAKNIRDPSLSETLRLFAEMEKKHYNILCKIASELGYRCINQGFKYKLKKLLYSLLFRVVGYKLALFSMELSEKAAVIDYWEMSNEPEFVKYRDKFKEILIDEIIHEQQLYRELRGFNVKFEGLKDAVYGMVDALVEIEAGVVGVATATSPIIAGVAGLLASIAGSLSMASGAYLSSRSENEVLETENKNMEILLSIKPVVFIDKLIGDLKDMDDRVVNEISELVKREPGLLPILMGHRHERLNPKVAALNAGVFYVMGSIAPVLPFLLGLPLLLSIVLSITLTQIALLLLTALISMITGSSFLKLYAEYSVIVLLFTSMTILIGKLARSMIGIEM
ncbi:MAG: VIT1/CCC1 transporter family protein [Desulfurococcaceae archaeon]